MTDETGNKPTDESSTGDNVDQSGTQAIQDDQKHPTAVESQRSVIIVNVLFWGVMAAIFLWKYYGIGDPVLQVVASANQAFQAPATGGTPATSATPAETPSTEAPNIENWVVRGHIIYDGRFISGADVWAIGEDGRGNRYASNPRKTDAAGAFELQPLPGIEGAEPLTSVEVFGRANPAAEAPVKPTPDASQSASADAEGNIDYAGWLDASAFLSLGGTRRHRVVSLPTFQIGLLAALFFISIIIALVPVPQQDDAELKNYWLIGKYITSVILAGVFTAFMIGYISAAMGKVNVSLTKQESEILLLGFGNIYRGRYVSEAEPEWLFSLTSPHFLYPADPAASEPQAPGEPTSEITTSAPVAVAAAVASADPLLTKGFGAPLWVIFVAVIGSALFTISIIVQTLKDRILDLSAADLRARVQSIVLHQFYILFAPLGAIFVFQLMVMLGMAKQEVTIAITILAAGIALNFLLDAARKRMTAMIEQAQSS